MPSKSKGWIVMCAWKISNLMLNCCLLIYEEIHSAIIFTNSECFSKSFKSIFLHGKSKVLPQNM